MAARLQRYARLFLVLLLACGLGACALFQARDPVNISVIVSSRCPGRSWNCAWR